MELYLLAHLRIPEARWSPVSLLGVLASSEPGGSEFSRPEVCKQSRSSLGFRYRNEHTDRHR